MLCASEYKAADVTARYQRVIYPLELKCSRSLTCEDYSDNVDPQLPCADIRIGIQLKHTHFESRIIFPHAT